MQHGAWGAEGRQPKKVKKWRRCVLNAIFQLAQKESSGAAASRAFRLGLSSIGMAGIGANLSPERGPGEGPQSTHCGRFPHDTGWTAVDPLPTFAREFRTDDPLLR